MSDQFVKTVVIQAGQTIWDIAVQEYGSPEGVILILQANPVLNITDALEPGRQLLIWTNKSIETITEIIEVKPLGNELYALFQAWAGLLPTCNCNGGVMPVQEQSFEFCLQASTIETFNIDIYAAAACKIDKAILESNGNVQAVTVKINNVTVTGIDEVAVSGLAIHLATAPNFVAIGDRITLITSMAASELQTFIRGKLIFAA